MRARSLLRSTTCTLSIMDEGRFLVAACGSSPKNSLPSTRILVIVFPPEEIEPSLPTVTPGRRFSRSPTVAFTAVWYESALYSRVSSLAMTAVLTPRTTTSASIVASSLRVTGSMCSVSTESGTVRERFAGLASRLVMAMRYFPGTTSGRAKRPSASV